MIITTRKPSISIIFRIMKWKMNISIDDLWCEIPDSFKELATYVRELELFATPDYNLIRSKITEIGKSEGIDVSVVEEVRYDEFTSIGKWIQMGVQTKQRVIAL
jgi:hypothetical protein